MHLLTTGRELCFCLSFVAVAALAGVAPAAASSIPDALAAVRVASAARLHGRDLGHTAAVTPIVLAVTLNYRNESELESLVRNASDPASAGYGRFLTPQEFTASFAPTPATYFEVARTFARAGFRITQTFANRTVLDIAAPAAVVERYFGTSLHDVATGDAVARYANVRPAYMPASLRRAVFSIGGFDDLRIVTTKIVRGGGPRTDVALGPPLQGPDTGLGPLAFATAYDYPVQHRKPGAASGSTYDGAGRVAGIAIDSDILDSDLTAYLSYFNVKRTGSLQRTLVDGGPGGLTSSQGEATLDAETIGGLAPGAGIHLYLMNALTFVDIIDTYNKVVADAKVDVLNSSFGGCESQTDPAAFPQTSDHIAEQGAAEGITFAAASGDSGAYECFDTIGNPLLGVATPASGPHFTAVGATSLLLDPSGAYRFEIGWTFGGGGVSQLFALPAYQAGIKNVVTTGRNVPDIAFDGNYSTGASVFLNGAFAGPFGGTSLSSPLFCALVTEIDQVGGRRAGSIDTALYARYKTPGASSVFRDIIYGNNGVYGPGFGALPGYDQITGLGSLIGWRYAN